MKVRDVIRLIENDGWLPHCHPGIASTIQARGKGRACHHRREAVRRQQIEVVYRDMLHAQSIDGPHGHFVEADARTCDGVPAGYANLVITSPPYPNNYNYADATRLEMSKVMGEIKGWGDLQSAVRRRLASILFPARPREGGKPRGGACGSLLDSHTSRNLRRVRRELGRIRLTKGGKKDIPPDGCVLLPGLGEGMACVASSVPPSPCRVCFVVGDSAPYGVYVPAIQWLGKLALDSGFHGFRFEKVRDRNIKWKNRKHRVPLCEGRLWVDG